MIIVKVNSSKCKDSIKNYKNHNNVYMHAPLITVAIPRYFGSAYFQDSENFCRRSTFKLRTFKH